jgi:hypothetical protein
MAGSRCIIGCRDARERRRVELHPRPDDGLHHDDSVPAGQAVQRQLRRAELFVGRFAKYWLWAAVGLSLLLQAFSTLPLSTGDWLVCAAASSVLWVRELSKLLAGGVRYSQG